MAIGYEPKHGIPLLDLVTMTAQEIYKRELVAGVQTNPNPDDETVRLYKQRAVELIKHSAWELRNMPAIY